MKRKNYAACLEILTMLVELRAQIASYAHYGVARNTIDDAEENLIQHAAQVRRYIVQVPMITADDEIEPVRIAVIGAFSSGKSTLINALLNRDINPTNISVTTASITEFRYARETKILKGDIDQRALPDDRLTTISHKNFTRLVQHQPENPANGARHYFRYYLNHPVLEDITLIDTPGFQAVGRTTGGDTQLTEMIAKQADAFLVIGDMTKGNLDSHAIAQIKNIQTHNPAPAFLFLNKADTKNNPSDREDILQESLKASGNIFVEGHTISAKTLNEINEMRSKIKELTRFETSSEFSIIGKPHGASRYQVKITDQSGDELSYKLRQNPESALNTYRLREIFFRHVKPKAQAHAEEKKKPLNFPFRSVRQAHSSVLRIHNEIRRLYNASSANDDVRSRTLRREARRIERQLEKLRITLDDLEIELEGADASPLF